MEKEWSGRSVRNMCPGLCVMTKGSFAVSATAWGVTPQAVALTAKLPFVITHSPGHMFLTDLPDHSFSIL